VHNSFEDINLFTIALHSPKKAEKIMGASVGSVLQWYR